jgi:hypothetical protein
MLSREGKTSANGRLRQQAMWNAMRSLSIFSAAELAAAATTEEARVTIAYASGYATALRDAGYLMATPSGHRNKLTYRLKPSANTGPRAPMLLNARVVYDANRNKVATPVTAEEEA